MKTRKLVLVWPLSLLLLVVCCTKKPAPEVVVFDDWWNLDYLKNACWSRAQYGRPCAEQPDVILSQVENALLTAFVSEPTCHDVRVVRYTSDMANATVKDPGAPATGTMKEAAGDHWSLILDINPDNYADGEWSMVRGDTVLRGNLANPPEVVRRVCAIAQRKGGTVAN